MTTVAAFEAKTKFGEILDRVVAGEEIVITRHDKPVARIIPEGGLRLDQIRKAAEGLESLQRAISRQNAGNPTLSWADFKAFVEEGRR